MSTAWSFSTGVAFAADDAFTGCDVSQTDACTYARCVADVAIQKDLRQEAVERLEGRRSTASGDPCLLFELGALYRELHDSRALEVLRDSKEQYAETGDSYYQGWASISIAEALRFRGRFSEAAEELEGALNAAREAGESDLLAMVHLARARLFKDRGKLVEASRLLHQAEVDICTSGNYHHCKHILLTAAIVAYDLGDFHKSQILFKKLEKDAGEAGDAFVKVAAAYNFAEVSTREALEGQRNDLRDTFRELVEEAEAAEHSSVVARASYQLGRLSEGAEARRHLERAVGIARRLELPDLLSELLLALAANRLSQDPDLALELLAEGRKIALENENSWPLVTGSQDQMEIAWATLPPDRAYEESLEVFRDIEKLRDLQKTSVARAGFLSVWSDAYYWLSGRVLESGGDDRDLERAFAVIERLRARSLLDALELAGAANSPAEGVTEPHRQTLSDIVKVQLRLLDPTLADEDRARALGDLEEAERREEEQWEEIAKHHPDYAALREPSFATLADVEASLGPDEALFSFQLAPWKDVYGRFAGGSWLLVVTHQRTRAYRLAGRKEVEKTIQLFGGLGEQRENAHVEALAAEFYGKLLGDALADLPADVRKLVLIPDGALHLLPFGVLQATEDDPPLATRFELQAAPSATLWLRWRRNPPGSTPPAALTFADPTLPETNGDNGDSELRFWLLEAAPRLTPLRHARDEGRRVAKRLGAAPSHLRTGDEASERSLKQTDLSSFGILHFAAHAFADSNHPGRSAILLAADSGREEDGLLQFRDIVALDLDGKLVVLSACQTAAGDVQRGEGVLSLARAFFQAGARTVVGSFWPLADDEETIALIDAFYRQLTSGQSVARALQAAQVERIRAGAPVAAWAGLTVLGDGDFVPFPGGLPRSPFSPWAVGGAVVVIVAAILAHAAYRRRTRPWSV